MQLGTNARKGSAVGIILLFIVLNIAPGINAKTPQTDRSIAIYDFRSPQKGHWMYVGGTGPGNYTRIQDAINDSDDGDTIFIYATASPYYEHLRITKSISLQGEAKKSTIIDGGGKHTVIDIEANRVAVGELTVRKGEHGINFAETKNNCTIYDTIVQDCSICGIHISKASFTMVKRNNITNCSYGIGVASTSMNEISNNCIEKSRYYGLYCYYCSSIIVTGNTIINNEQGVYLDSSTHVQVTNNTFLVKNGIKIFGFFPEYWATHTIQNNTIDRRLLRYYKNCSKLNLSGDSCQIILANCTSSVLHDLNCSELSIGVLIGCSANILLRDSTFSNDTYGIMMDSSKDLTLMNNTIFNDNRGILLAEFITNATIQANHLQNNTVGISAAASRFNRIIANVLSYNGQGILFSADIIYRGENDNVVVDNTLSNNGYGITCVYSDSASKNNHFYHNTFLYNGHAAYEEYHDAWNSCAPFGGNYWSDYTGVDDNHDGIGDTPYDIKYNNRDNYPLMAPYNRSNEPPGRLRITGPLLRRAEADINYTFNVTDPNGDCLFFFISWGDGTTEQSISPLDTTINLTLHHAWKKTGLYTITVTADDPYHEKTNRATHKVLILAKKGALLDRILTFLERFPLLKKIIEWLFGGEPVK